MYSGLSRILSIRQIPESRLAGVRRPVRGTVLCQYVGATTSMVSTGVVIAYSSCVYSIINRYLGAETRKKSKSTM